MSGMNKKFFRAPFNFEIFFMLLNKVLSKFLNNLVDKKKLAKEFLKIFLEICLKSFINYKGSQDGRDFAMLAIAGIS